MPYMGPRDLPVQTRRRGAARKADADRASMEWKDLEQEESD